MFFLTLVLSNIALLIWWRNICLCLDRLHVVGVRHCRSEIWPTVAPAPVRARFPLVPVIVRVALGRVSDAFPTPSSPPVAAVLSPTSASALVAVLVLIFIVRVAPLEDPLVLCSLALCAQLIA